MRAVTGVKVALAFLLATCLVALTAISIAGAITQTTRPPKGTSDQQTHPKVHPRRGTRRSKFRVRFTLRDAPGHEGAIASEYDIRVDKPRRSRAACAAPDVPALTSGTRGSRRSLALRTPRHGWCHGRYAVTVILQRGPYCPPPPDGQPPPPCPKFATTEVDVGHATFSVKTTRRS
ncbi:MAG: hypothetical protein QOG15_602 [Solirubrobacteraceae bacterium]|jgi:hypothetical protein|nr:hypothetical protein [Solirubrobacteraceae bacterium]